MRGKSFKKIKGLKIYLLCTPVIPSLPHCQRIKESDQQMLATVTFSRGIKDDLKKKKNPKTVGRGSGSFKLLHSFFLSRQGSCFSVE